MQQEKGMSRHQAMQAWLLKEKLWLRERRKQVADDGLSEDSPEHP